MTNNLITPTLDAQVAVCGIDPAPRETGVQWKRVTDDGVFNRQRVHFTARFGYEVGNVPIIPNRYRIIGLTTCGWNRRQRIVIRLLGLDNVIAVESVAPEADKIGWALKSGGLGERFGFTHLRDFYAYTDPNFVGKGTSPAVIDEQTGKVVTNNYHTLTLDLETVWKPYHKEDAPDLYPQKLRSRIDLLNQQLFDDANNGTYKVLFADNDLAAKRAYDIFDARLADYDYRLSSRRYLFGSRLTDSDVRLFQTLEAYESMYRPGIARRLGDEQTLHVWDYPNLWAYARDLFQTPGFIDDEELYDFGYVPGDDGKYSKFVSKKADGHSPFAGDTVAGTPEFYQRWNEPADRSGFAGDEQYSGPGTAGLEEFWKFGAR